MRSLAPVAIALAVAACNADRRRQPRRHLDTRCDNDARQHQRHHAEGWGPRARHDAAEVTAAVGPTATPNAVGGPDPESRSLPPANAPEGLLVMIRDDRLTSIQLRDNTTLKTDRGFGHRRHRPRDQAAYGEARSSPARYSPPANTSRCGRQRLDHRHLRRETPTPAASATKPTPTAASKAQAGGASIQLVEGCRRRRAHPAGRVYIRHSDARSAIRNPGATHATVAPGSGFFAARSPRMTELERWKQQHYCKKKANGRVGSSSRHSSNRRPLRGESSSAIKRVLAWQIEDAMRRATRLSVGTAASTAGVVPRVQKRRDAPRLRRWRRAA